MFGLGPLELLLVLGVVVVLFGGSRLPQLGRGLGEGIRNFRAATREPPEIEIKPEGSAARSDAPPDPAE
jgi:sec-independent protein translocase protein TatA